MHCSSKLSSSFSRLPTKLVCPIMQAKTNMVKLDKLDQKIVASIDQNNFPLNKLDVAKPLTSKNVVQKPNLIFSVLIGVFSALYLCTKKENEVLAEEKNLEDKNFPTSGNLNGKTYGNVRCVTSLNGNGINCLNVRAGTSVNINRSTCENIKGGTSVTLVNVNCKKVEAGTSAYLDDVKCLSVQVGCNLDLEKVTVEQNVETRGNIEKMVNSTIQGKLTCSNEKLILDTSSIGSIFMNDPKSSGIKISANNNFISVSGNSGGSISVSSGGGGTYFKIGDVSNYVSVSDGSSTKTSYIINGKVYKEDGNDLNDKSKDPQKQTIAIGPGSKVIGNIEFTSKNGVVIVEKGGEFGGKVIGGTLETT